LGGRGGRPAILELGACRIDSAGSPANGPQGDRLSAPVGDNKIERPVGAVQVLAGIRPIFIPAHVAGILLQRGEGARTAGAPADTRNRKEGIQELDGVVKGVSALFPLVGNHARRIRRQETGGARDKMPGDVGDPGCGVIGKAVPGARGEVQLVGIGTGGTTVGDHHRNGFAVRRVAHAGTSTADQPVLIVVPTAACVGINGRKKIRVNIAGWEPALPHPGRIKGSGDGGISPSSGTVVGGVVVDLGKKR